MDITEQEFRARVDRVRNFMAENKLGSVIIFSVPWGHLWHQTGHIGYISNWASRDRNVNSIIVVTKEDEPVLLYAGLPYMSEVIRTVSWIRDVRIVAPDDPRAAALPGGATNFGKEIKGILDDRGIGNKKIGLMGAQHMPLSVWRCLCRYIPESQIEITDDIIDELRCIKSPAELGLMRRAAELADLGYTTLVRTAKKGMRGYEVVAEMEHAVRREGADFVQFWLISGPSEGWRDTWPIVRPHERRLEEGDQIICGAYVVYKGYWAHGMRAGSLGKPSPQQKRYMSFCMAIHQSAINAVRPGIKVSQVIKKAINAGHSRGVKLSSTRIGHGIGMDYSEMPFMIEENDQKMSPNMVIVIHPQVTLPETGGFIVPLGDMCLVTESGMERLMQFPMEPFRA